MRRFYQGDWLTAIGILVTSRKNQNKTKTFNSEFIRNREQLE